MDSIDLERKDLAMYLCCSLLNSVEVAAITIIIKAIITKTIM